jgi:2'-5' RNA ligase
MPRTTRTFIAIAIPAPLGEKLTRLQSQLAPSVPGVRWTATSPFHVTLAFLGDVEERDLNNLCRAVAGAVAGIPRFEARVEGVGAFPDPARPRVIWAGLTGPDESPLHELHKAVARAATTAGYRPDDQRFHPHVTLGRMKSDHRGPRPPDLMPILEQYRTWSAGSFTVHEVVTFGSTLTPEGPIYAPLAKAPLSGRKTDASP